MSYAGIFGLGVPSGRESICWRTEDATCLFRLRQVWLLDLGAYGTASVAAVNLCARRRGRSWLAIVSGCRVRGARWRDGVLSERSVDAESPPTGDSPAHAALAQRPRQPSKSRRGQSGGVILRPRPPSALRERRALVCSCQGSRPAGPPRRLVAKMFRPDIPARGWLPSGSSASPRGPGLRELLIGSVGLTSGRCRRLPESA